MSLTGGIVLYAVLWFLVLFVLLPIGQQSQADVGQVTPGTPAGAPHEPKLKKKMLWATLIAALIWGAIAYVIIGGIITRADLDAWTR
ncbi:DUF1467 family protein [Paracoccus sp. PS-1]|uniref:DUF1467 family protein n=1 Tax=unclassified Paracoccus (in: a-proteobacteria) TaxID=2688777 RepID=UPI00048D5CA1|nr:MULTISPECIES: DUF1467 family protein [unclassified Paracoccus (in: a-proteobacteria)]MDQ7263306.1 DUF1467 family protein [Paracoccus sp. PS1]RQP06595.1 MAG: DUF1467 family protein [Paracoccus sp. BP8]UFM66479.1 DUF1467 family protein [Paracoccus sp. MA]